MCKKTTLPCIPVLLAGALFAYPTFSAAQTQHSETLKQAQTYIQNHQGVAAYELLLPLEDKLAGTYTFDLFFGRAALAAQQSMRDNNHIDPDLYNLFLEQRVWEIYAQQVLAPEQLDVIDPAAYQ